MLCIDDIPQQVADDIHGFAVILRRANIGSESFRAGQKSENFVLGFFIQAAGLVYHHAERVYHRQRPCLCKVSLAPSGKQKENPPQGRDFPFWPTRKDSNLRPSESESDALSSCATGRYEVAAQCRFERPTRKTRALHAIRCAKSATCAKGCKQPSNLRPPKSESDAIRLCHG